MHRLGVWEGVVRVVGGEALIVEDEEVPKFNQGDKLHGKSLAGQELQRPNRRIVGATRARESVSGGREH